MQHFASAPLNSWHQTAVASSRQPKQHLPVSRLRSALKLRRKPNASSRLWARVDRSKSPCRKHFSQTDTESSLIALASPGR